MIIIISNSKNACCLGSSQKQRLGTGKKYTVLSIVGNTGKNNQTNRKILIFSFKRSPLLKILDSRSTLGINEST